MKGNGTAYPSLVNIKEKYNQTQVKQIIENGRNMLPAFKQIPEGEIQALLTFLLDLEEKGPTLEAKKGEVAKKAGGAEADNIAGKKTILDKVPYTMTGYNRFLDKDGYPGIKPPWGPLNAVDLNSGKLLWKVPLGEYTELTK
ncbi:hypothetical protein GXP67_00125 [Rhodocytophaga rosea]|uniref:Pyrrolo-quinoline quinone repeat domain-containing protein n=1 Tax=Rhodocytophaga rosea TaxID=2704465 RepID=A0A6C0GB93_9BACT|nr:hypothetical protein [Rhodocytophaga rosea]QHT65191.1 hypothetical protein GXP67_00125 [Rhodocytophaga rosea]